MKKPVGTLLTSNTCPICGDPRMIRMTGAMWCPIEDAHPGGVVVFDDGLTKASGIAPRSKLYVSPKDGGPTT